MLCVGIETGLHMRTIALEHISSFRFSSVNRIPVIHTERKKRKWPYLISLPSSFDLVISRITL